ncbi:cyclic nucleotide-binding domain-containing protein [Bradyrhizobium sp. AZCC 2289]|uniref:cyclic nucleotide-binding domain-containing protein n=1 Tax=Bradyrhizobium sp. AZCC 2289 TaxID=3117026 RepID=UPI003FA5411C
MSAVPAGQGENAVIAILGDGDFFGEGCFIGQPVHLATATAITDCSPTRIKK